MKKIILSIFFFCGVFVQAQEYLTKTDVNYRFQPRWIKAYKEASVSMIIQYI